MGARVQSIGHICHVDGVRAFCRWYPSRRQYRCENYDGRGDWLDIQYFRQDFRAPGPGLWFQSSVNGVVAECGGVFGGGLRRQADRIKKSPGIPGFFMIEKDLHFVQKIIQVSAFQSHVFVC